jgi:hypothetical protein
MRRLIATLAVTVGILAGQTPAGALNGPEDGDVEVGGASVGDTVGAYVQFGRPPARLGAKDSSGCSWQLVDAIPDIELTFSNLSMIKDGITYLLFVKTCGTTITGHWIPQTARPSRALGIAAAARLTRMLPKPTVGLQPPANLQTINIPTWYWTTPQTWRPISVTAWVPTGTGIAWATTTATPVRLRYHPGNGQPATQCAQRGTPQREANRHLTGGPGSCTFTYTRGATPGDTTVQASLAIDWAISWTSNVSAGGQLNAQTTTTAIAVDIDEIQALVTG